MNIWKTIKFKWRWFWMCDYDRAIWEAVAFGMGVMMGDKHLPLKELYKAKPKEGKGE